MSDIVINLNNKSKPMPIKYAKSTHGFSDSNNDNNKYLFELSINGKNFKNRIFRKIENTKYSHLITLDDMIKLNNIDTYEAKVSIFPSELPLNYNIEGEITWNISLYYYSLVYLDTAFIKLYFKKKQ